MSHTPKTASALSLITTCSKRVHSAGVRNSHCALHQKPRAILLSPSTCHGPRQLTTIFRNSSWIKILASCPSLHHFTDRRLPNGLAWIGFGLALLMLPPVRSLSAACQARKCTHPLATITADHFCTRLRSSPLSCVPSGAISTSDSFNSVRQLWSSNTKDSW